MVIKKHPSVSGRATKVFFAHFVPLVALVVFETQDRLGETVWKIGFALVWIVGAHMFYRMWRLLKRVPCPECGGHTVAHGKHPALPGVHSSHCARCDVLWDLGVGNSD